MRIWCIKLDRYEDPIFCKTLEVAQQKAKRLRESMERNFNDGKCWRNIHWVMRTTSPGHEYWSLRGTLMEPDGIKIIGKEYVLGPDLYLYDGKVLEDA